MILKKFFLFFHCRGKLSNETRFGTFFVIVEVRYKWKETLRIVEIGSAALEDLREDFFQGVKEPFGVCWQELRSFTCFWKAFARLILVL